MNPFRKNGIISRGQATVEFAILLPVVISAVLGAVELSNMYLMSLRVSNMSRQAANIAFRDCAYLPDNNQSSCLANIVSEIRDEGDLLLNSFSANGTVVASTYVADANQVVRLVDAESAGDGNYSTQFDTSRIDTSLVINFKRVAIGEVFYRYTPVTPIGSLFTFLTEETVIYESTVF
ncbi:MAG: pilus assembly protein [Candidatus Omnitrophica bacterium]|nr:pilus assembly protein [Candidatus Omnitrophota bacterium]MDD5671821.1 pilus assembly protein [Candidatus Omnitrophota bacterium]